MDNKNKENFIFSAQEEMECYITLKGQLIKLLYIIESEQRGEGSAKQWLEGFIIDLKSANVLCNNKLTKVIIKIYGLYDNDNYKTMTHSQIKRQVMESRGILDYLINGNENMK